MVDQRKQSTGVQIAEGRSASEVLFSTLERALTRFPDTFSEKSRPGSLQSFKKNYTQVLPHFELARITSPYRHEIAQCLADTLNEQLCFNTEGNSLPLAETLTSPASPLPLATLASTGTAGWKPQFPGQEGRPFLEVVKELEEQTVLNTSAARALGWISDQLTTGLLSLKGHKVAVLGANAEMAPTRLFLEAGADVLWVDINPPPKSIQDLPTRAGQLTWIEGGADLLTQPQEILATIKTFAGSDPTHVCLYAYAPGQARELRLTGVMNAIVNALPRELIASITLLLSPTTATPLNAADLASMQRRRSTRPTWEALLDSVGILGRGGGCVSQGEIAASGTLVGIQGASYQAAQYLAKLMTAEAWAHAGLRISATTAAITKTRSLSHPVFDAAFGGARAMQVETFTPEQSQCMNGLLAVHDWLHPSLPIPAELRIHGGIHTLPYPLNTALRTAAAIGFARSPGLLFRLFR